MTDQPDTELLDEFVRHNSEAAFASLAQRHLNLVYSSALRQTGNPSAAEEVTQAVFIVLARKAPTLQRGTILPGWLYRTTRLTAANWRRAEARRVRREREAVMQSITHESPPDHAWRELSVLLDDAMARLGTTDRDALVLRYFQNKTLPEVGRALGMEERAAQKRVARALEKLRKIFSRRGVVLTATLIAGAISANSVQAAPAELAASVGAAGAKNAMASATLSALANGTVKAMAWLKIKFVIAIGAPALAVGGAAVVAVLAAQPSQSNSPESLTTNSPFIQHVQNPPWIKYIRFKHSDLFQAGATPARIERTQWGQSEYAAGLQPGGFFCERLSTNPPGFGPPTMPDQRGIAGMNENSVWSVFWQGNLPGQTRQLRLSSRKPGEGGAPGDYVQSVVTIFKSMVERVRLFGLPPLAQNSFQLGEQGEFRAITDKDEAVEGRYSDVKNDRPHSLTYRVRESALDTTRQFVVKYYYASAQARLPDRFEISEVTPRIQKLIAYPMTNWIEAVEYGIDSKITDGYYPSNFFANVNLITEITIASNKAVYRQATDKIVREVHIPTSAEADADQRRLFPPRRRPVMLYWLAGLAVFAAAVWVARRMIRKRS